MRGPRPSGAFGWTFAALALVALLPLWTVDFLPLTDLPQHEAQVSVLRHWQDPACGYPGIYEIRWFSPYWLTYALAWALAALVPVPVAFKVLLSVAVVAIAWIAARSLRELGGDPWWALACLPLAYGSPTSWGFVSFVVAVPCVLALLAPGLRYARAPSLGGGLALGFGCAALFFVHILALLFAGLLLAATVAAAAPSWRALPRRLLPLLVALPLPLAWGWQTARAAGAPGGKVLWLGGWQRLTELPVLLTAIPGAALAALAVAALGAALVANRPRAARERLRWAPFLTCAAIVLLAPNYLFGTAYLAPRFAIFLLPTLLLALDRVPGTAGSSWRRAALVAVTLALLAGVELRFLGMAREGDGLAQVLAAAPAGQRLLYLAYDRQSRFSPEAPFLHSGMRYAVDRCGVAERSFARNFQQPVGYRPGSAPALPTILEYMPYRFRWDEHGGDRYDLFLVRAAGGPPGGRIDGGEGRLELLAQQGRWWLYRNVARR